MYLTENKTRGLKVDPSKNKKWSCVPKITYKKTRPEVSKLTPGHTGNSKVTKLRPAESRLKHIDRHTKTMNSF